MKKARLLLICGALALVAACSKDFVPEPPAKDAELTGETVNVSGVKSAPRKLFVLNEGGMGSNNSTLDFLRFPEGTYVTGAFKKMNPDVGAGLGDVGNDIAVNGDEVWMVINNSGIVEVVSAKDETEIAAIPVATPRNIAFDDTYAYVTSWAGAFATGSYDADFNYVITDSSNPKGQVFRINLGTKKVEGSVEVGYQPEGIAYYDGKLYVANSGGISSQLPPAYSYDNTLSIIDAKSFKVVDMKEVEVNLKGVWSDGKGTIYVSTMGNYWDVHSGVYALPAAEPSRVQKVGTGSPFKEDVLHVSCACMHEGTLYCIGTENEFDWSNPHTYNVWSVAVNDVATGEGKISMYPLELGGTPYCMSILDAGEVLDMHYLVVGDAGDYFNPGTVSCWQLDFNDNSKVWSVNAGVCPGHFAIW